MAVNEPGVALVSLAGRNGQGTRKTASALHVSAVTSDGWDLNSSPELGLQRSLGNPGANLLAWAQKGELGGSVPGVHVPGQASPLGPWVTDKGLTPEVWALGMGPQHSFPRMGATGTLFLQPPEMISLPPFKGPEQSVLPSRRAHSGARCPGPPPGSPAVAAASRRPRAGRSLSPAGRPAGSPEGSGPGAL